MSSAAATPADQASMRAGNGGIVPPPEHRWRKGQSGNPKGRPSAGAAIIEWINALQDKSLPELTEIAEDESAAVNKRAAARAWLAAVESGSGLDRVCDRTEGRPVQRGELSGPDGGPIQVEAKATMGLIALLGGDPDAGRETVEQDGAAGQLEDGNSDG